MRLLTLDGTETWGQLAVAVRNLRHTQQHVGDRSVLGQRIEDDIRELNTQIRTTREARRRPGDC